MKYKSFYWNFFKPCLKKSVAKRLGDERAKQVLMKGKSEYRRLCEEAPDIGKGNPYALNAYFAYVYIGLWLGADGELTSDTMAEIMGESLEFVSPLFKIINFNKPSGVRLAREILFGDYLKWYNKHGKDYPDTWIPVGDSENRAGLYYELHSCPICKFCKSQGISEIMPPLCEMDNMMFKMMHGKLTRHQTIASGGSMCDYWVVGDKENDKCGI